MVLEAESGCIKLVLLVVHIAGLWQFLQPLSNKDSSVGVAVCGPGTSFHTLLVVYLEKEVRGVVAALGWKPPLLRHGKPIIMTTREPF